MYKPIVTSSSTYPTQHLEYLKIKIPQERLKTTANLNRLWQHVCPPKTFGLVDHTDIGEAAWGQLPTGAMAKVCAVIQDHIQVSNKDVVCDWGFGLARWLTFLPFLFSVRDLVTVGLEKNERIFGYGSICLQNVAKTTYRTKTSVMLKDSTTVGCFCGASIVVNYDGGIQTTTFGKNSKPHLEIMTAIFRSPSVRAVVSTKLDMNRFLQYFPSSQTLVDTNQWKLVRLQQPGGQYGVSVWLRKSDKILRPCELCNSGNKHLKKLIDEANAVILPRFTRSSANGSWYF